MTLGVVVVSRWGISQAVAPIPGDGSAAAGTDGLAAVRSLVDVVYGWTAFGLLAIVAVLAIVAGGSMVSARAQGYLHTAGAEAPPRAGSPRPARRRGCSGPPDAAAAASDRRPVGAAPADLVAGCLTGDPGPGSADAPAELALRPGPPHRDPRGPQDAHQEPQDRR